MEAFRPPEDGKQSPSGEGTGEAGPGHPKEGQPSAAPRSVQTPPNRARPPEQDPEIGVVLRRRAPMPAAQEQNPGIPRSPSFLGRTQPWGVVPLPPSKVDNKDRSPPWTQSAQSRPPSSKVDNSERSEPPRFTRPVDFSPRAVQGGPSQARGGPSRYEDDDDEISLADFPNVDNLDDRYEAVPQPQYIQDATPTRFKGLEAFDREGRQGPDRDVVKLLRDAKKQQLVDRAKARGRDPNDGAVGMPSGLTRSAKTQQQYLDRGNQLLARYRRERGILQDDLLGLNTVEFADWVLSLKPDLKSTTWRPYKQSAKAVLATLPESDEAIDILDADRVESGSEPERKPKKAEAGKRDLKRRTSAMKAKSISKPDFQRMVDYLRFLSGSKYGRILSDWLLASMATGLRPAEWMATTIEEVDNPTAPGGRNVYFYVVNAKATNNRGNGAARTIDLTNTSNDTIAVVKRMSERGREWLIRGEFEDMQGQCAQLMYNTAERMFPGRKFIYSLYTMRHQFIANAKSYHKPESISAMVGHVVTNTAIENYGKKRSAWNLEDITDRADPVAEEVATVRRQHEFYNDRVRLHQDAGMPVPRGPSMGGGED